MCNREAAQNWLFKTGNHKRRNVTAHLCTLLHFRTCDYLFLCVERLSHVLWTRNNFFEFLAFYGVILQSDYQPLHTYLPSNAGCINDKNNKSISVE